MTNFRLTYDPTRTSRVTLENKGFDEFVLYGRKRRGKKAPCLIHIEVMSDDHVWMQVGDAAINIVEKPNGDISVGVERGEYGPAIGFTNAPLEGMTLKYEPAKKGRRVKR